MESVESVALRQEMCTGVSCRRLDSGIRTRSELQPASQKLHVRRAFQSTTTLTMNRNEVFCSERPNRRVQLSASLLDGFSTLEFPERAGGWLHLRSSASLLLMPAILLLQIAAI